MTCPRGIITTQHQAVICNHVFTPTDLILISHDLYGLEYFTLLIAYCPGSLRKEVKKGMQEVDFNGIQYLIFLKLSMKFLAISS